jgi:hypothetical protein
MRTIFTRKDQPILVDDDNYEWLNRYTWRLDKDGYAVTSAPKPYVPGTPTMHFMHRMVMGLAHNDPRKVDHRFQIKQDNRRSQLRICSNRQNNANSIKRKRNKSGFKGVVRVYDRGLPWRASIVINGKQRYLGLFETAELAHEFYCLAADMVYGEFANYGHSDPQPLTSAYIDSLKARQEDAVIAPPVQSTIGGQS